MKGMSKLSVHEWIRGWKHKPSGTSQTAENADRLLADYHREIGDIHTAFQNANCEDDLQDVIKSIADINQTSLKVAKTIIGSLANQSHVQKH